MLSGSSPIHRDILDSLRLQKESSKKPLRFQKKIKKILLASQSTLYPCNQPLIPAFWEALNLTWYRAGRGIIGDLWTFSESRKKGLTRISIFIMVENIHKFLKMEVKFHQNQDKKTEGFSPKARRRNGLVNLIIWRNSRTFIKEER